MNVSACINVSRFVQCLHNESDEKHSGENVILTQMSLISMPTLHEDQFIQLVGYSKGPRDKSQMFFFFFFLMLMGDLWFLVYLIDDFILQLVLLFNLFLDFMA